jgi:hypothetical protein
MNDTMVLFANPAIQAPASDLAPLQDQLLLVAIYAGAVRAQIAQPMAEHERHRHAELLTHLETAHHTLAREVAQRERARGSWWRWRR